MTAQTYECFGPKGTWNEGRYTIDFEDATSRKVAIWYNGSIAATGYRTKAKALRSLLTDFHIVKMEDVSAITRQPAGEKQKTS